MPNPGGDRVPAAMPSVGERVVQPSPYASPEVQLVAVRGNAPWTDVEELAEDKVVQGVLARNPTLAQMFAAWQAASARYPQVVSLEDPMVAGILGPGSFGSRDVDFAYRIEVSQRLPFPGKRGLRGQNALNEAAAAGNDVDDTKLALTEIARMAFFDYYQVERAIALNDENGQVLKDLRKTAEDRFKANQAPEQEVRQAEVEIGRNRERRLALDRTRKIAVARINTLMHLSPDSPLPPPPKEIKRPTLFPKVEELRSQAIANRPDLQASMNRIQAEEAALQLAYREYYPDMEVMAAYDAFWQPEEKDLRAMVGVRVNLPVQLGRRDGSVSEASARIAQRRAQLSSLTDQVHLQVQEAFEQVHESEKAIKLYDETILPAARENLKAAQTAYVANKIPFVGLLEAQRNLIELRDRYNEIRADSFRRRATLERVIGGPLPQPK